MEADVYDALTTKRVYKDAFSHEQAVQMIGEEAGRHFDPQLVDAFLACSGAFLTINRMGQPALALGSQEAWQSRALV